MIESIEPLPKIPSALRDAALQRKIIPFIGAGVSQLGGCPGWPEFADAALKFFVQKDELSQGQFDQLVTLSSRVKLSLALGLEKQRGIPIEFEELLTPTANKKKIGDDVYANLARLATTFVTTNYDDWLTRPLFQPDEPDVVSNKPEVSRKSFCKRSDITLKNLDVANAVFHIHGSVHERDDMVLTTVNYLERYAGHRIDGSKNPENAFVTFLQHLFKTKNVLFIGYGLSELEILEQIIAKGIENPPRNDEEPQQVPQHYVLQGFFSHDLELARSLDSYFRSFGIGLLPFSRDEHDWEQLVDVVKYLADEIPPGPAPMSLTKRREMRDLLP